MNNKDYITLYSTFAEQSDDLTVMSLRYEKQKGVRWL